MLPLPDIAFARPTTIAEAVELLRGEPGDALLLAGGTDLLPAMKRGLAAPKRVVSLRRVAELRGVRYEPDGALVIGAATTIADIASDARIRESHPALAEAAALVASPQIRNAATLGGNLCLDARCAYYEQTALWRDALGHCLRTCGATCHVVESGRRCVAAASADTPAPLLAYGAGARLVSHAGERTVPLASFFVADGARNTVRAHDELVVDVHVPSAAGTKSVYEKLRARRAIDFPQLGVALAAWLDRDVARRVALVVTALGARPRVVSGLDAIASGRRLGDVVGAMGEVARAQCRPLANVGGDPEWRRDMVPVLVRRAVARLGC